MTERERERERARASYVLPLDVFQTFGTNRFNRIPNEGKRKKIQSGARKTGPLSRRPTPTLFYEMAGRFFVRHSVLRVNKTQQLSGLIKCITNLTKKKF